MLRDHYDLVIGDQGGLAYDDATTRGIGGSEYFVIHLARALADRGLHVLVLNEIAQFGEPREFSVREVARMPVADPGSLTYANLRTQATVTCGTLLLQRGSLPPAIMGDFERVAVAVHDAATPKDVARIALTAERLGGTVVCVSEFQRAQYPAKWKTVVIPPKLVDLAATADAKAARDPKAFLYLSAAVKGWSATEKAWRDLRARHPILANATLSVLGSGYSSAHDTADPSIVHLGELTTPELVGRIRRAAGIFYVNTMEEMFPLPLAMADALGTRTHVLCKNGMGGVREATSQWALVTDDEGAFEETFLARFGEAGDRGGDPPVWDVEATVAAWREIVA